MPTYVYECSSCASQFEVEQRITEPALDACACGSSGTVKRIIQPTAVMFKGGGFHINDYSAPKPSEASETKPEATACSGEPKSCPSCAPTSD
jgi:putative FmdB family regulatory protein